MRRSRKRRVALGVLAGAVSLAAVTSAHNAARAFGLSPATVRAEMRRCGVRVRRPGNYTRAEAERIGPLVGL